jgi:hypothetical protein
MNWVFMQKKNFDGPQLIVVKSAEILLMPLYLKHLRYQIV